MRKLVFISVVLFLTHLSSPLFGETILSLKWGEEPHHINYYTVPDGIYGISDFYVDGEEIGILSHFDRTIKVFEKGVFKYQIENIPDETILMERLFKKTYVITRGGEVFLIKNNTPMKIQKLPYEGNISAVIFDSNLFYPVSNFEKYVDKSRVMDAIIENPNLFQIRVYEGDKTDVYSLKTDLEVAAITPIGLIDNLMVAVVEYEMGKKRHIEVFSKNGEIISTIVLPNRFMLQEVREVRIFENKIFVLATDKEGLKIYRFNGYNNGQIEISKWTNRLIDLNGIIPEGERLLALTPVKRSEALALAKDYNDHVWTAKSCNVGTTTCTDWCNNTKTIKPPSWVVVGTNNRFPYSWGGFSSISQFDQGLIDCKKAGDIQTRYSDGTSACGSSCSVGVDCSGFVSRLWKQTTKYGTSTIMQIATKINKSDLKPADALNDSGSHIRLFVGFRSDGKWDMVESYAGSGYWGVGYTVRTPAENDGYDAIRYNAIVDDSVPTNKPPVISHTPVSTAESGKDIVITAKITDDGGKIAAATLRYKNEGESNFTAINMTDKGSSNFEAIISASAIKSTKIYYYIAAWDGESPVQTGVNRSILPEKAEDSSNPQYFIISITKPNTPPVIVHTPVTTAYSGENIVISAKITDDSGKIQAANIKYKNEGDSIMKTINMVDKGGSIFEATILSSFITANKIYYYIAAWDGESPVQTGRNRSILPETAEDLFPVYFTINIITSNKDAGLDVRDTSIVDAHVYTDTYTDNYIADITNKDENTITDFNNIEDNSTLPFDAEMKDVGIPEEDVYSIEDIKHRTSDLKQLGVDEEESGCSCTVLR